MYKNVIYAVAILFLFAACGSENGSESGDTEQQSPVTVKEVVQSSNYTYLKIEEAGDEKWMAVKKMDAAAGDEYYYTGAMLMENFESKELERTFEKILFVDNISKEPISDTHDHGNDASPHGMGDMSGMGNSHDTEAAVTEQSGKHQAVKQDITVVTPEGAITIGELYKNKQKYDGKPVKVSGIVTKFSPAIMDRNWVHLQDGTEHDGNFDLTLTTLEAVEEGDTVVFEGTVALDKDFGYGYFYQVLVEESELK
jgi:hypothetical protein